MSWSETLLFLIAALSIPAGMAVYYLGEVHGSKQRMQDQRGFLEGRTWLWVDGLFYPVDATDEQMDEVRAFETARLHVMKDEVPL